MVVDVFFSSYAFMVLYICFHKICRKPIMMKILKKIILIVILSTVWSCTNKNFFEFDEIEHYSKDISDNDLMAIYDLEEKIGKPTQIREIVEYDFPETVDVNFDEILIKNGYKKTLLNKEIHSEINDIFSENICLSKTAFACIPVYRDIFLFKNEGKIIGIAKICFECEKSYIIGTKKDVIDFGQCGGFEELSNLIK